MRMIVSDHRRPAVPRRTVSGQELRGIDLEPACRIGSDVAARHGVPDAPMCA